MRVVRKSPEIIPPLVIADDRALATDFAEVATVATAEGIHRYVAQVQGHRFGRSRPLQMDAMVFAGSDRLFQSAELRTAS